MKTTLILLLSLSLALPAAAAKKKAASPAKKAAKPAPAAKAAADKKAPASARPAAAPAPVSDGKAAGAPPASAPPEGAASPAKAPAPEEGKAGGAPSLDVNIVGDAKDEIPITKNQPPTTVPFERVAGLSREGQTDRVLSGPVEHMAGADQMRLLQVTSIQAYLPLPVRIPQAPFIRMEISPGLSRGAWELQLLDQENQAMKALAGTALPRYVLEWDGFQDGVFKLRAGPAYTPVLIVTDDRKRQQRIFGEPVQFAALQYIQGGVLHVELDNSRLFERGRTGVSTDMASTLSATLNILRRRVGRPIHVALHAAPGAAGLAHQRLGVLRKFFKESLALEDDQIDFSVQPVKDRGQVTDITVSVKEEK